MIRLDGGRHPIVTAFWGQVSNALLQCGRRQQLELAPKQPAIFPVLPDRVAAIALCNLGADKGPPCALTKGFGLDSCVAGFHRQRVTAARHELVAHRFQGMQTQQPEAFTFDNDPVLIAVRQYLSRAGNQLNIGICEVGRTVHQFSGPIPAISKIDCYLIGETQGADRCLNKMESALTEPPKRRAEIGA